MSVIQPRKSSQNAELNDHFITDDEIQAPSVSRCLQRSGWLKFRADISYPLKIAKNRRRQRSGIEDKILTPPLRIAIWAKCENP
jgi:hypothetical protein